MRSARFATAAAVASFLLFGGGYLAVFGGLAPTGDAPIAVVAETPLPPASREAPPPVAATPRPPPVPCLGEALRIATPNPAWAARAKRSPAAEAAAEPRFRTLAEAPGLPSSSVAFVRDGAVRIVTLPAGDEREIVPPHVQARDVVWSPDGRRLAFAAPDPQAPASAAYAHQQVFLAYADGSSLRRVSTAKFDFSALSFSPDGQRLAFATDDALVLVDLAGGKEQRVPLTARRRAGPLFAPTGSHLVVTLDDAGGAPSGPSVEWIELPSLERQRVVFPNDVELSSLAFLGDRLLVARMRQDGVEDGMIGLAHIAEMPTKPPFVVHERGPLVSSWGGDTVLVAPPRGDRYLRATRVFARVFEGDSVSQGDWLRNDFFVVGSEKAPNNYFFATNGDLPQPRFDVDQAAWAPDSRHLAFTTQLRDFEAERRAPIVLGEGIVAVDTLSPHGAPILLACGHAPAWGPPAAR